MIIAERYKIGAFWYDVLQLPTVDVDHPNWAACIDHRRRQIRIQADLPAEMKEQHVFHELVHGACDLMEIECDEPTVARLATGLHLIFSDNGLIAEADPQKGGRT